MLSFKLLEILVPQFLIFNFISCTLYCKSDLSLTILIIVAKLNHFYWDFWAGLNAFTIRNTCSFSSQDWDVIASYEP